MRCRSESCRSAARNSGAGPGSAAGTAAAVLARADASGEELLAEPFLRGAGMGATFFSPVGAVSARGRMSTAAAAAAAPPALSPLAKSSIPVKPICDVRKESRLGKRRPLAWGRDSDICRNGVLLILLLTASRASWVMLLASALELLALSPPVTSFVAPTPAGKLAVDGDDATAAPDKDGLDGDAEPEAVAEFPLADFGRAREDRGEGNER